MESLNTPPQKPWHKHGWLWFVIAIPLISIFVGVGLAITAVVNKDTVVKDDWYKDGKAINRNLSRDQKAKELGLTADIIFDATTGQVNLTIAHTKPINLPEKLTLIFSHATQSKKDEKVALLGKDGIYQGFLNKALQGSYSIEIGTNEWRLSESATLPNQTISLGI